MDMQIFCRIETISKVLTDRSDNWDYKKERDVWDMIFVIDLMEEKLKYIKETCHNNIDLRPINNN